MTLFEYLTVAISIVLSMSIVRSLEAVGDVIDPARRDPIHVTWFALKASQPALMWWSIWGLHDQPQWNYPAFLLCLAGPIFLFLQITTLVTREPDEVSDWREHFERCRRRFFLANLGLAGSGPLLLIALGDLAAARMLMGGVAIETTVSLVGLSTSNRRVHALLAVAVVVTFALWTALLFEPVDA